MHPCRNDSVLAGRALPRSFSSHLVPFFYWGGFFKYRGISLTLCRCLCATNRITGKHGRSLLWLSEAASKPRASTDMKKPEAPGLLVKSLQSVWEVWSRQIASVLHNSGCAALESRAERSGGESQRLEGDCCACEVPTLGAARRCEWSKSEDKWHSFDAARCPGACVWGRVSVTY